MSPSPSARERWSRQLAGLLGRSAVLPEEELRSALEEALASGLPLVEVLLDRGRLPVPVVLGALGQLAQLPVVDLTQAPPEPEALAQLPPGLSGQFGALACRVAGGQLLVAFGEPPDPDDLRALAALAGASVVPALADPRVLRAALRHDEPAPSAAPVPALAGVVAAPVGVGVPANGNGHAGNEHPGNGHTGAEVRTAEVQTAELQADRGLAVDPAPADEGLPLHIDDLLRQVVALGASDLHLTATMPACMRLHGAIRPVEGCPPLTHQQIRDMVFGILPQAKREQFEAQKELDTSHAIPGVGRFRLNVFQQRGTVAAVLRTIPHEIPPFDSLGLPASVARFAELRRGLVLVTGPTGSGKSTTLAALVDIINKSKPLHIVTVEDPIEFLHQHQRSIVNQREVGQDTQSFAEALRRVLREDPDVILVGELRDLETISMALTAAETGHLVFGTLHTQDAPQTIDRIVDVFPTSQQEQVRTQLAASLEGVVTQQLVPAADGTGRVVAAEVMVCTSAVRNLIRQNKTHQIYSLMQTGAQHGMQTMDQALARLVKEQRVSEAMAFDRCRSEEDLRNHLRS
ncbi:PilT/PilU family type 4a pilus ATPase [Aciditerrimonas ferrireducens]|uniref:PilT/PilU family type 4a pilus ATPase n=1 Tax=Aciditerrimonas ferrireducens TaxID=667306 RepID=UPI00200342F8|nr:PilT/PilU family type 4a pilus ATPase [Aciditerrimonas ferrireducens]MCK4176544.1 PilT/PilU family type 4a pilus ATPase [Aciditerrimonas ferrireducens]